MKYSKFAWGMIALAAGLGLGACGGGGGGATSVTARNTSVGVITGFGSVYVNGCEYETDSASISVEGNSGTEDDLSVGDVVEVSGPANCTHANASHISSADELEGWVDSVSLDPDGIGTMVVMGQTVSTTAMTAFEDYTGSVAALADVAADNVIEVQGYTSDQGTVLATRIEVKATSLAGYLGELELKGVVQNLDVVPGTFDIGTLNINYTSLSPSFTLANDLFVEVKFNNTKTPVSIEIEDDGMLGYQGDDDEEIEVKGVLSAALSGDTFMVGDQVIQVTNNTEYEEADNGQPALVSQISDGNNVGNVYLEVEGHFNNNMLIAESIDLEDDASDNNECKGIVSNLVLVPGERNMGTLTVTPASPVDCAGQVSMDVTVDNNTMMEDDSNLHDSKFNLTALKDGDLVDVHVDPATGIAIKLERE